MERHRPRGPLLRNPAKTLRFFITREQQRGPVKGEELRRALEQMPVLNATLLDYLPDRQIENPHFIPQEWKYDEPGRTRTIFFRGSVYRQDGDTSVRCLRWNACKWEAGYGWTGSLWNDTYRALLMRQEDAAAAGPG